MADQIEINIYMKDGVVSGEVEDSIGTGRNISNVSQSGTTGSGGTQNKTVDLGALGKYVASQTVSVFLANTKSSISQNIGLITGKTELQQRVNFGMSIIEKGASVFASASAGAVIFGPAGAMIGALASITGEVINTSFAQQQINIKRNLENIQIQQIRNKAGAGFNRSREGN